MNCSIGLGQNRLLQYEHLISDLVCIRYIKAAFLAAEAEPASLSLSHSSFLPPLPLGRYPLVAPSLSLSALLRNLAPKSL